MPLHADDKEIPFISPKLSLRFYCFATFCEREKHVSNLGVLLLEPPRVQLIFQPLHSSMFDSEILSLLYRVPLSTLTQ